MKKSALSVYMYGLYQIMGVCLPFLLTPDFALGVFGLSAGDGMWVRFVGVLAGLSGFYFVMAVYHDVERFYGWTVPARFATAGFLLAMVVLGRIGPMMLLFAAIDALAGSLTWAALTAEKSATPA
jgi:hypothetical protein